uniref:Sushi domain-containing protein n=1 Tax=Macrostomum lignano TaxID=282301 RepID=A0A1I8ILS2_9PLAT
MFCNINNQEECSGTVYNHAGCSYVCRSGW